MSRRASIFILSAAVVGGAGALAGCPQSEIDICFGAACGVADGASPVTDGQVLPPNCDITKDPKDSSACVDESIAFFVSSSGSDAAAGSKTAPLATISAAIAKTDAQHSRIYVCDGSYSETLTLTKSLGIYGGFGCGDWTYDAGKTTVTPPAAGVALQITNVNDPVAVQDLEFDALAGTDVAPSSIAAFVNASPHVTFSRVTLTAGAGSSGKDGVSSVATILPRGLKGNNASGTTGGPALSCPCPDGATVGGAGGNYVIAQTNGDAGLPNLNGAAPNNGQGGLGGTASCSSVGAGGIGGPGADGDAGVLGPSATTLGIVDGSGFHPQNGADGTPGGRAQGGGGGGATTAGSSGAGGGGCGGCGGAFGGGGAGGGASIALVTLQSPVILISCTLAADVAGNGGKGGDGQTGAAGGASGSDPAGFSCSGGLGGNGGNGASGGGGAGGISAGIVQKGSAPVLPDSATKITAKTKGAGGAAGAGGGVAGIDGAAENVVTIP